MGPYDARILTQLGVRTASRGGTRPTGPVGLLAHPLRRQKLRPPRQSAVDSLRVWSGVVLLNSVVLTVFLWHMTALVIAGLLCVAGRARVRWSRGSELP